VTRFERHRGQEATRVLSVLRRLGRRLRRAEGHPMIWSAGTPIPDLTRRQLDLIREHDARRAIRTFADPQQNRGGHFTAGPMS
jgi:hypothetical protein